MGKRSNFERREVDFYPTPRAAVVPLIPYLARVRTFAEPCAGDGNWCAISKGLVCGVSMLAISGPARMRWNLIITARLTLSSRTHLTPAI